MLPIISGGHSSYQDTFVSDFSIYYPDLFSRSKQTWRSYLLSIKLKVTSITVWVSMLKECPLYAILSGFPA